VFVPPLPEGDDKWMIGIAKISSENITDVAEKLQIPRE
jgi:hypothetical protein